MIKATATFYFRKALNWIENKPYENYMLKVSHELLVLPSFFRQNIHQNKRRKELEGSWDIGSLWLIVLSCYNI